VAQPSPDDRGVSAGEVVRVAPHALDAMVSHAREAAPGECCGLLVGAPALVEEAARARNTAGRDTRYLIDPADHFAAIRRARASERQVVGAYHSHPFTAARPSVTDVEEAHPDFLYLIVSLAPADEPDHEALGRGIAWQGAAIRGWRLRGAAHGGGVLGRRPSQANRPVGTREKPPGNFAEVRLVADGEEKDS
jgi:[CysO sulfur-carrier protein]-S-L-cysteine hydrolase